MLFLRSLATSEVMPRNKGLTRLQIQLLKRAILRGGELIGVIRVTCQDYYTVSHSHSVPHTPASLDQSQQLSHSQFGSPLTNPHLPTGLGGESIKDSQVNRSSRPRHALKHSARQHLRSHVIRGPAHVCVVVWRWRQGG